MSPVIAFLNDFAGNGGWLQRQSVDAERGLLADSSLTAPAKRAPSRWQRATMSRHLFLAIVIPSVERR